MSKKIFKSNLEQIKNLTLQFISIDSNNEISEQNWKIDSVPRRI